VPDLYVSALGTPYRGVIAHGGGERAFVKIAERAGDDFALDPVVWIDSDGAATGAQASFLERSGHFGECYRVTIQDAGPADEPASEWQQRELLAVVLRRLINAAEQQTGEGIQRLTLVVPAGLTAQTQSEVLQAGLLAGAQELEVISVDRCVAASRPGEPSTGPDLIVEAWDDLTRLTVTNRGESAATRVVDLSAKFSRELLRGKLLERFGSTENAANDVDADLTDQFFTAWASGRDVTHGVTITRPLARAAPVAVHVPASTFARLDSVLAERIDQSLKGQDIGPDEIGSISVVGSWTRPIAQALRSLVPERIPIRDQRGAELDAAIKLVPPQARAAKPTLSSEILAVAESARTLRALSQGEPISLLRPGVRLPATSVSENFKSSSFLKQFSIAAKKDGNVTPLMSMPIPLYAERQPSSYLRTVVHAETPRFIFMEAAYLYPTQRRFSIYDRDAAAEIPVDDHVFRVVRG
jgi:hypothetical protein